MLDITASSCSTASTAAHTLSEAVSPRVTLCIAVDKAGDSVKLTCLHPSKDGECFSALQSVAAKSDHDSDGEGAASEVGSPSSTSGQVPRSCARSGEASPRPEAGATSASGDMAASSAAAEQTHDLLPVLLMPLRLKGDYCNVAVLNASEATLALMRKIDDKTDEVVVDDSEVIRILNGHIGRPVSAVFLLPLCSCMHA